MGARERNYGDSDHPIISDTSSDTFMTTKSTIVIRPGVTETEKALVLGEQPEWSVQWSI